MAITAVLAPTNTGKTHRAVERMLEHESGMIGLPLRLLAREVYDRVTARIGESEVALVTGEEKRVPEKPRYWVCTVESMPISRPVDFVAIDEIQLSAHRQRGHVFTDRLLHSRGRQETWLLGAETMRPLIRKLLPSADIRSHPRLSQLRHVGAMSLRSLPPRSAVVAFSAHQVYELAERLRQRRGGVAVVLGALSPRTRNAQVALYQSGEVQYMVATDAIGMGLNMDVDHIAFAALHKYDGREDRPLAAEELAQIAGRAGRYRSDGTFGTLTGMRALSAQVVRAIENHRFRPVAGLIWRNSDLDMRTIETLTLSLSRRPELSSLTLVDYAEDFRALTRLGARPDIRERARGREAVELLWDVCQIPDFRKLLEESHIKLLGELFLQLSGPAGRIDSDWMGRRIDRLDNTDGDIDTLMSRIAFVRTWTYVSHHSRWVEDAAGFRERTRAIEDRLSDALHDRLVARFVERQRRRRSAVRAADTGAHPFGQLRQFLSGDGDSWLDDLIDCSHGEIQVDEAGLISFRDRRVARMTRGVDLLRPEVTLLIDDLGAGTHARLIRRLTAWTRDFVTETVAPLRDDRTAELSSPGRGLVYQLERGLGTTARREAAPQLHNLEAGDRAILDALGIVVGACTVYLPELLGRAALTRRVALTSAQLPVGVRIELPARGAASLPVRGEIRPESYMAVGYPVYGTRAIRADMAERVHRALAKASRRGPFAAPPQLPGWLGARSGEVAEIVTAFGYLLLEDGRYAARQKRRRRRRKR